MSNWSDWIPDLAKIPFQIYENRHKLHNWWQKLLVFVNLAKTNILIDGRPATGKSLLSSQLFGEARNLDFKEPGKSDDVEIRPIQLGEWSSIVTVLPGDTSLERNQGLQEAFHEHDQLQGVIYMVDYGFTLIRDDATKQDYLALGINTIEDIRKKNMEKELEDFKSFVDNLISLKEEFLPVWIIIGVNKVDLFMNALDKAQMYYQPEGNSPFSRMLKQLIKKIGELNLKIITLPVCCWEINYDWNGQVVESKLGGTQIRNQLLLNFINEIAKLQK